MIEVIGLYFKHRGSKEYLLKDINFFAKKGTITTILGPNGSGKSTLFKCIVGVWKVSKGDILVNEIRINDLSFKKKARFFSVVPQEHTPTFPYSVFDFVLMGRAAHVGIFSFPEKKDRELVLDSIKTMEILHLKDKPYTQISGGERQLVLIARSLAQQTPVMLLDEPTSQLDFGNQIKILSKIKEIAVKNHISVILTLHDPNLASIFSDKIIVIQNGKIIKKGDPNDIITKDIIEDLYKIPATTIPFNGKSLVYPSIEEDLFLKICNT